MKIALIGVGNLGMSIAKGLISQEQFEISQLILADKRLEMLKELEAHPNVETTDSIAQAVAKSDIVIVCVQPRHAKEVVKEVSEGIDIDRHLIISTITGTSIDDLRNYAMKDAAIIRSMPNTAISVGQSMTCLCANELGEDHLSTAKEIFNAMGKTAVIEENMMQAATVICASGIAYWMRMIRATTLAGVEMGFEADEAKDMAIQACTGAANLLTTTGNHPEEEIDRVTTPNGCTIAGLNEMEHQGVSSAMIEGLMKAYKKISDISDKK